MEANDVKTDVFTSKDFALFLVALLNGADEEQGSGREAATRYVAGPSPDPADRPPTNQQAP
jgi:hypothetical protein